MDQNQNQTELRRERLQKELEEILGSKNVYFQPPNNTKLKYPCIIYKRDVADAIYADDRVYSITMRYALTIISRDPDNDIYDRIAKSMRYVTYNRNFIVDGLNHDVLYLYY